MRCLRAVRSGGWNKEWDSKKKVWAFPEGGNSGLSSNLRPFLNESGKIKPWPEREMFERKKTGGERGGAKTSS